MPLYEYKCDRCNAVFEVIQKFADEPLTVHEACGGAVERLLSAPAFQFKGSGWYVNDYARKGNSGGSGSSKSNGDSGSKSEAKSESKSESKSDSKPAESKSSDSKPAASK